MKINCVVGNAVEVVDMVTPVMAMGNIEDWLLALEAEMQRSVRKECRIASLEVGQLMNGLSVGDFGNKSIAQVALLGIQLVRTGDFQDALLRQSRDKDRTIMGSANKKF
eukprot:7524576-Heterocapsa_arctica.AAC.1